jgi:hypothetical protein
VSDWMRRAGGAIRLLHKHCANTHNGVNMAATQHPATSGAPKRPTSCEILAQKPWPLRRPDWAASLCGCTHAFHCSTHLRPQGARQRGQQAKRHRVCTTPRVRPPRARNPRERRQRPSPLPSPSRRAAALRLALIRAPRAPLRWSGLTPPPPPTSRARRRRQRPSGCRAPQSTRASRAWGGRLRWGGGAKSGAPGVRRAELGGWLVVVCGVQRAEPRGCPMRSKAPQGSVTPLPSHSGAEAGWRWAKRAWAPPCRACGCRARGAT